MPIRAIVQVRDYQGNEIILMFVTLAHDLEDADHGSYGLLTDYIFRIAQLFNQLWNVSPKGLRCECIRGFILKCTLEGL